MILTHRPTEDRINEIVDTIAEECEWTEQVSWFISEDMPPAGFGIDVQDQFLACKRDAPDSVFLTVLMENFSE